MSEGEGYQDFVTTLESFKDLKSGISGSRIKKLTTYALEHVEGGEILVNLIINYSKTCQDSHKLGSLYIIDSIGRAYLDEKRQRDEYIKPDAKKGTFAYALYVLGEAIDDLVIEAVSKSNEDHKDKIRVLVDIWDRSGLFQKGVLNAIRSKCFAMEANDKYEIHSATSTDSTSFSLPMDPKERFIEISRDLKPLNVMPQVDLPDNLTSSDLSKQQVALFQLLTSLQQEKYIFQTQAPQSSFQPVHVQEREQEQEQASHVITEYGSRRDREKERDRYPSNRNRSRSPQQRNNRENRHSTEYGNHSNSSLISNNHHLYPDEMNVPSCRHYRPKPVSFDPNLAAESVKVFSRTIFIGGVPPNMKEWDLASILRPFAEVQSVILNNPRKHAFVKVYSRQEAENVLLNFNKNGASPLRTRWGVGFGPRDCCDYQYGFSVIPMHRLTDADKKWCVQAQWGGTNGEPLVPGIVFEEPDIIVGEGVSSKAISQKMPTDSNRQGPRSGRGDYNQMPTSQYGGNQGYSDQRYQQYPPPPPPQQSQVMGYNQPMPQHMNAPYPPQPPVQHQQQPSLPQQQQQQSFDPTAHLNSLMSMLNQQQQ